MHDVLGDWCHGPGEGRQVLGKLMGERRQEPAGALPGLMEVAGAEEAVTEQP